MKCIKGQEIVECNSDPPAFTNLSIDILYDLLKPSFSNL